MTWSYLEDSDELSQSGAVEEIYGYSISEFQQNKILWYDVIYPEDRRYLDKAIESLDLKYNQEISVQYRIIHKEGYGKNVLGSIKIEERDGRIVYGGYITDMSSHNKSIIAVDYRENLLELLKESLHTLSNSDKNRDKRVSSLLEKLSELVSADRVILYKNIQQERGQFLKMLSHQFKTHLSIIQLNVRMLERVEKQLRVDDSKNYRKKIERIQRAVENIKELIETILIKESYKTEDSVPETLDINKTVEKFVDKTRRDHEGDIDINNKTTIKSPDITLPFSQKTFEFILKAIIFNAIKYSDQDIPKVQTEVKVEGGFLEFGVQDYGIGIHEEDLEKIGTAFYRGGNVEGIAGIGIGLSMVKEALHSVGGLIEIDSKLGEYTKVLIKIPIDNQK